MADQIKWLNSLFVRKDIDLSDDKGDNNTNGKYWEVKDPKRLESWSIVLVPMIENVHFVIKFDAGLHALPIFADKWMKEVAFYKGSILHIHCKTIDAEPYAFTIVVNNMMLPFSVVLFLSSLKDSPYKALIKENENEIN